MMMVVSYCMSVKPAKAFKFNVRTFKRIKFAEDDIAEAYLRCRLACHFTE